MARLTLALAVLGCACSTTIAVERPLASDTLAEINSMLDGRNAIVVHATPARERQRDIASAIALNPEKARWTVWESDFARERGTPPGRPIEAPIDAMRNITLCDAHCHATGALEGAGFGLLAGIVVGAIAPSACDNQLCRLGLLIVVPIFTLP